MSERKPKVIVFDLDYTLWPFWVDTNVTPPFKKVENNAVVDEQGKKIQYYKEVPEILKKLHDEGFDLGVASRTSEIRGAFQLLNLFGWDQYFKYKEIYPGCKVSHFNKIREASGVDFEDMIFFDDEDRNIRDLSEVGVLSILVKNGVTDEVVREGLDKFAKK
ncbi:magnesium-dependent phosphatase 1 [Fopius arisanus]|uniref:Magnesium-dependent phosphatase 1 n=1 Tax=Fopius arisanus TaxID=64838 RepID=A0A9R1TT65_9HYME|nr:PREDICTED: magnesium-dependent phosphatase 1-like [Fopius arisanus]